MSDERAKRAAEQLLADKPSVKTECCGHYHWRGDFEVINGHAVCKYCKMRWLRGHVLECDDLRKENERLWEAVNYIRAKLKEKVDGNWSGSPGTFDLWLMTMNQQLGGPAYAAQEAVNHGD